MRRFVREARALVLMTFGSMILAASEPVPHPVLQALGMGLHMHALLEAERPQQGSEPLRRA